MAFLCVGCNKTIINGFGYKLPNKSWVCDECMESIDVLEDGICHSSKMLIGGLGNCHKTELGLQGGDATVVDQSKT